jgi:hypothetical protein
MADVAAMPRGYAGIAILNEDSERGPNVSAAEEFLIKAADI